MDVHDALENRRSIISFKPDEVPESVLKRILQTVCFAPSACNRQASKLVVLRDPAERLLPILGAPRRNRLCVELLPTRDKAAQ